jgi:hypothetical protein
VLAPARLQLLRQPRLPVWLQSAAARPEEGWTREELETHLCDEYSTFTWLLEPMITRAGFEIATTDYGRARSYANYLCVKPAS